MRTWTGTSSPIPTAGSSDSFSARQSPLAQVGCMVCALLLAVFGVFWISGMTFVGDYMGWDLRLVLWTVVGAGLLFLGAVLSFARAITDRIPRVLVVTLLGLLAAAVGTSVAMYETSRGTSRAPERTTTAPDTTKPLIGKAVTFGQHPVAGKRFDVRFDVMRSSGGPMLDGAMVCTPTVAGKVIRHTEEFISGSAWLFASIPKTAKGKLLAVKLTIRANGHAASKTITFPIH